MRLIHSFDKTFVRAAVTLCVAASLFAAASALVADHHEKGEKTDKEARDHALIEKVMNDVHKGKDSLLQKILKGEASKKQARDVIRLYIAMENTKAPAGDQENWEKLTVNLSEAAIDFYAGKDGAAESLRKAVHCKTCHNAHKPD